MHRLIVALFALCISVAPLGVPIALADDHGALFVNATSDEGHRALMALTFAKNQLDRQHPVTIFLNDRGVLLTSRANEDRFKEQQALLMGLMKAGATVLVCPMCMQHYGVKEADLLPGIKVASPELVGSALFHGDTRALSW